MKEKPQTKKHLVEVSAENHLRLKTESARVGLMLKDYVNQLLVGIFKSKRARP